MTDDRQQIINAEMQPGTRFTARLGKGKGHDSRIWTLVYIKVDVFPVSGKIITYCCRCEETFVPYHTKPGGSYDWYFLQNPTEEIERGDIRIIDAEANIEAVENALEFIEQDGPIPYDVGLGLILEECSAVCRNNDVAARDKAQAEYAALEGK